MSIILSPLTKNRNVSFVRKINKNHVIKEYKKFKIDVSRFFSEIEKIEVYECNETGYQFFHPFNLSGNSKFYEHFQTYNWYYMPWKWEHEITLKYISNNMSVLEVGCAQGAFIEKINDIFTLKNTVGLELNESAKKVRKNWKILNQTIQSFSEQNKDSFDLVCSYQVLEHISEVKSFLSAKIGCLKKDGKLIISVPNNDSYIKHAANCLNEPPHHMGLWNEKSLRALESLFSLKVVDIHFEELQKYHIENYVSATFYKKFPSIFLRKVARKLYKLFGLHKARIKKISKEREKYIGQTILVIYQKL